MSTGITSSYIAGLDFNSEPVAVPTASAVRLGELVGFDVNLAQQAGGRPGDPAAGWNLAVPIDGTHTRWAPSGVVTRPGPAGSTVLVQPRGFVTALVGSSGSTGVSVTRGDPLFLLAGQRFLDLDQPTGKGSVFELKIPGVVVDHRAGLTTGSSTGLAGTIPVDILYDGSVLSQDLGSSPAEATLSSVSIKALAGGAAIQQVPANFKTNRDDIFTAGGTIPRFDSGATATVIYPASASQYFTVNDFTAGLGGGDGDYLEIAAGVYAITSKMEISNVRTTGVSPTIEATLAEGIPGTTYYTWLQHRIALANGTTEPEYVSINAHFNLRLSADTEITTRVAQTDSAGAGCTLHSWNLQIIRLGDFGV